MAQRVVVVGNGLIGSAAARWLADDGHDVTVIGPSEPTDHATHDGVFSSHYDQGRLVSAYSTDPVWSWVARSAIDEFDDLQARSGLTFHHPVGRLSLLTDTDVGAARVWAARVDPEGADLSVWPDDAEEWRERFPYLAAPPRATLLHEGSPAGYVNPRTMLRAQNLVAERSGARLIDDLVVSVSSRHDAVTVVTERGERIIADRVVVAAGAFTNFAELSPEPVPLRLKTETTVWADVSETTAAACAAMPVITYDIDHPELDDIYLAPPIRYPDGVFRLKMGCNTANESWPTTIDEVREWFRSGASDLDLEPMAGTFRALLPGVDVDRFTTHRCIVTYTPSGYPMIDQAPGDEHGRIVVAVGGNGTGAQGSDALGRLAAGLVDGDSWPDGIERAGFSAHHGWDVSSGRMSNAQRRARQSDDTA